MISAFLLAAAVAGAAPMPATDITIEPAGLSGPLAGTLQRGTGDHAPAVLILPGSGPTDRDGNSPLGVKAATYRLLAQDLATHGITSLRIDKRGMFGSALALADANTVTLSDYVDDTFAWAAKLREITGQRCVWLVGHSEGGLIALAAAARSTDGICGVVALAAPGRPLGAVMREQLRANPANAPILPQAEAAIDALEKGEHYDAAKLNPVLLPLFGPQIQDFLISLFAADPAKLAAAQHLPLLILRGDQDLQVSAADAAALKAARPDARSIELPGVNHVLKPVTKGDRSANLAAYANPDLPIDPAITADIAAFIRARESAPGRGHASSR